MSGPAPVWPRERIIAACQEWHRAHGAPPKAKSWECGTDLHPTDVTVCRRFGTWNAMLVAAGFQGRNAGSPRLWTHKMVILACQAWAREHGEPPTYREWLVATPSTPNAATAQRLFGSWNKMLVAAGYSARRRAPATRWSKESIAEHMLDFVAREGRWPTRREWERAGVHPHRSTVLRQFGSWTAAKRYAGWNGVRTRRAKNGRGALVESSLSTAPSDGLTATVQAPAVAPLAA